MNLWNYYDGDLKYPDLNNHSHEKEIAKTNPIWAFDYTSRHGKDEELEPTIAKNAEYSLWYADEILNGPFKLGEPTIAKHDGLYSYKYALYVLKGPFKLGEPAIAKSAYHSLSYAKEILKGPFPLGEKAIAKNAEYSKDYTKNILKKDFYLDGKLICKYEE